MPTLLVKLVVTCLLIAQGLAALAPGQVLCIPVRDCGTHEQAGPGACGHCHADIRDDESSGHTCRNHTHGPASPAAHTNGDCGCHLHMPVQESAQSPGRPWGDSPDLRGVVVSQPVAWVLMCDCGTRDAVHERFKPPDFSVSDQVLALKATRLII